MKTEDRAPMIVSKAVPFLGFFIRNLVKVPFMGRTLGLTNKTLGRLLPRLSFLGFRKGASFENAVWNYEVFLKLIGAPYDVDAAS